MGSTGEILGQQTAQWVKKKKSTHSVNLMTSLKFPESILEGKNQLPEVL